MVFLFQSFDASKTKPASADALNTNTYAQWQKALENTNAAFHKAVRNGDLEGMRLTIKNGAKVNSSDDKGETALTVAAAIGNKEAVKLLLDNKADSFVKNAKGEFPDDVAEKNKHKDIAQLLKNDMYNAWVTSQGY